MPPDLLTAHDALDKAVDDCYGKTRFTSDAKRVAFLFELYDGLVKEEQMVTLKKKKWISMEITTVALKRGVKVI